MTMELQTPDGEIALGNTFEVYRAFAEMARTASADDGWEELFAVPGFAETQEEVDAGYLEAARAQAGKFLGKFGDHLSAAATFTLRQIRGPAGAGKLSALCGGPGSGVPGPCPQAKPEPDGRHAGSKDLHAQADAQAGGWLARARELPGKMLAAAKAKAKSHFERLDARYGRKLAVGIMAAGIVGTVIPVPGATLAAVAPMIGVAELYRHFRGGPEKQSARGLTEPRPAEDYTDEELMELGGAWTGELLADWNENDLPGLEGGEDE